MGSDGMNVDEVINRAKVVEEGHGHEFGEMYRALLGRVDHRLLLGRRDLGQCG